jgi:hypothetical protein
MELCLSLVCKAHTRMASVDLIDVNPKEDRPLRGKSATAPGPRIVPEREFFPGSGRKRLILREPSTQWPTLSRAASISRAHSLQMKSYPE